jgi:bacteriocin-like protein
MSNEQKSSRRDETISSADDLVKTGKKGDVELTEDELAKVSGGLIRVRRAGENPQEYLV